MPAVTSYNPDETDHPLEAAYRRAIGNARLWESLARSCRREGDMSSYRVFREKSRSEYLEAARLAQSIHDEPPLF